MDADVPLGSGPGPSGGAAGDPDDAHGGVEVRTGDDGRTVVRFWGAVDLAVRVAAGSGLRTIGADGTPVDVDCRDVTFMDSTGLSVLVRVMRDATGDGRPVRFLGATSQVLDLLETTGVDRWMESLGVVQPT